MVDRRCKQGISPVKEFVSICFGPNRIYTTIQLRYSSPAEVDIIAAMDNPSTILIVDDDRDIRSLLADYLDTNGYRALAAADGAGMWKVLDESRPDLIVLDLNLPGDDGLTLCRKLRATSSLPVIMLTARNEPLDRILGLEMGADDYLPKPFEPRELLARIRSVLRRSHAMPSNTPSEHVQQMRFAGWTLDLTARHLLNPEGIVIMLSGAEFRLLRVFLEHPNRVLNRDQLLNLTQGRDADPFDRSVDIQISRLRQKLGEDARLPQIIKTVRNGGYVLAGQVTVEPSA
jgi:two-component system OmpR family response regulator